MNVAMAIITTMAMPPMLRWRWARIPLGTEERLRLDREELDAKGFVPSGFSSPPTTAQTEVCSRLAGRSPARGRSRSRSSICGDIFGPVRARIGEGHEATVKSAAETVTTLEAHPEEAKQGSVDVTTRSRKASAHEAVAREAQKGYDLLVIGIENTRRPRAASPRR